MAFGTSEIVLLILSSLVSIFTLMSIGGNDVANSQGTAVGSGALSIRGAQIIAGCCEFAGAALVGHHVSNTIGNKMVGETNVSDLQLCWAMFSALLGVGCWMMVATKLSMPVSGTHSIVGAVFGLNLVMTNFNWAAIEWAVFGKVAIAWVVTPLLSFGASYVILLALNIWWPPDNDRDAAVDQDIKEPEYEASDTQRSSLLGFIMAPASAHMTPIATPSPHRNMKAQQVRLTWGDAEADDNAVVKQKEQKEEDGGVADVGETTYFEPSKFKFALIFGILVATLVIFLMIAGPPAINIVDGGLSLKAWHIAVICVGALLLFIVIGYLIETCYRHNYTKHILNRKKESNEELGDVEMAERGTPRECAEEEEKEALLFNNQDYFRLYLVVACGAVDFAQGGNDVANVLGPFGQIYKYVTTGTLEGNMTIPVYIAGAAGLTVALGFAMFGAPVLETIGKSITKLSYRSGFVAQFCSATTVLVCNVLGLPVSSSTVIVGGVSGVALYNSKQADAKKKREQPEEEYVEYIGCVNKMKYLWSNQKIRILLKILAIWIITIPANAIIAGCLFALINLAL
eukprot:442056_1